MFYSVMVSVLLVEEKTGLDIVPVFISVDPERDTVEQVREYVKGVSLCTSPYDWLIIIAHPN